MKTNGISRRKILRRARFATGSLNESVETAGFGTDSRSVGGSTGVLWVTKGFFSSRFDKRDRISRPTPASVRRKGQAKSPLGREVVKKLRARLEHVPPRTRGDFRGVAGNAHQVLIQQWLTPSSPPLEKGGRPTSFCKDSRIFSHLQGAQG